MATTEPFDVKQLDKEDELMVASLDKGVKQYFQDHPPQGFTERTWEIKFKTNIPQRCADLYLKRLHEQNARWSGVARAYIWKYDEDAEYREEQFKKGHIVFGEPIGGRPPIQYIPMLALTLTLEPPLSLSNSTSLVPYQ